MSDELLHASELDARLVEVAKSIKVLSHLGWETRVGDEFLAAWEAGRPVLPTVTYPAVDFGESRRELHSIMGACDRGHPIEDFLFRTAQSYDRGARMVEAMGKPDFTRHSIKLYGSPDDAVAVDRTSTVTAAKHLLEVTEKFVVGCHLEEADFCLTPAWVAAELQREAAFFTHHKVEIVVDPTLSAKAAAGATKIRIRGGTCFAEADVSQLLHHELFVHTLTALNGRSQPNLKSLSLGSPRTTRTQEGLALFSELITNSIDVNRLRRIAARPIAIDMGMKGADFLEVFRYFLETGQSEREACASAQRVFRGGDPRGNVVFTKDGVYLQGFVRIHNFLRDAILSGHPEENHQILAGRLRASDVARLKPFFRSGYITPPLYEPRWIKNRSTLMAFVVYSSFTTELHLGALVGTPEETDEEGTAADGPAQGGRAAS